MSLVRSNKRQNNLKRLSLQQCKKLNKFQQTRFEQSFKEIQFEKDYSTNALKSTPRSRLQIDTDTIHEASTPKAKGGRSAFRLTRKYVGRCRLRSNVQNAGLAQKSYCTQTLYEEDQSSCIQARDSYGHEHNEEQKHRPTLGEYDMNDDCCSEDFPSSTSRFPAKHSGLSLELPDSVSRGSAQVKRRGWPGRRPSAKRLGRNSLRNGSRRESENAYIIRGSMRSNRSRDLGRSDRAITRNIHKAMVKRYCDLEQDTKTESSKDEVEMLRSRLARYPRRNLRCKVPSGNAEKEGKFNCIRLSATGDRDNTPVISSMQLDNLAWLETVKNDHEQDVTTNSAGDLNDGPTWSKKLSPLKLQKFVIRRYKNRRRVTTQNLPQLDLSIHHPCSIVDNIGTFMSFLSVLDLVRMKRVCKTWKLTVCSVLKKRYSENITVSPPSTPKMGGTLIWQLTLILPRLQQLTLSLNDFKDITGPIPVFVLSHICRCQDLAFLRIERFSWGQFDIAVKVIVSHLDKGQRILNGLQVLELPNASLPIPTSTQCMKPLSIFSPTLRSLTLNCAQDSAIFSLRLFMPSVKSLILLNTLCTTQRFAQLIAISPMLMKPLMKDRANYCPRTSMRELSRNRNSAGHGTTSEDITPTFGTPFRRLTPGCVVTPNDEILTHLPSGHNKPLHVVTLGRVCQMETGNELSKGMLQRLASFCSLIGSLIIMPRLDDESPHHTEKNEVNKHDTESRPMQI